MKKIYALICISLAAVQPGWAQEKPLKVVTTQTIFADLVRKIGGERVAVSSVASPKFNIHFIQPKPSDVRKVTQADVYVNGGLDLEAWSDPLLEAAGKPEFFRNAARNVNLAEGIPLLEVPDHPVTRAEGDIHASGNPHFHMNPENARIMAHTILAKLKTIDPAHDAYYQSNADQFLKQLDARIAAWKNTCAHCRGQEIISYHKDIAYLADFFGITAKEFLEPKPGIPPTPKHLAFLEDYAKAHHIKAIVMPTYYPRGDAQKVAERLGIKVATVIQGAGEVPGTGDFFAFFDYNCAQISEALR